MYNATTPWKHGKDMKVIKPNCRSFKKVVDRNNYLNKRIVNKVTGIISNVRQRRDQALLEYTNKFDKVKLSIKDLKVSEREINASFQELDSAMILALKEAIDNVFKFYRKQLPKNFKLKTDEGRKIEEKFLPLERVGMYIPGGQAPLVSSVYMCAIPAIVAGVKDLVLVSPPDKNGFLNPYILAVASILKIKEIYKVGGAQAVAGLAIGTDTIKRVDKIVGPGNEYVTEAKRQLFGTTGIDMLAGPSEIAIVAGKKANLNYIIKDLEAQTEHRSGIGLVVVLNRQVFNQLKKTNIPNSYLVKAADIDEAAGIINDFAPEHLEVMLPNPSGFVKKIHNAGAIFMGDYSPVPLGDYIAGPSHVLPTSETARFFSGLGVYDFLKRVHVISYSKKALVKDVNFLEKIAGLEGMTKHIESVRVRL